MWAIRGKDGSNTGDGTSGSCHDKQEICERLPETLNGSVCVSQAKTKEEL